MVLWCVVFWALEMSQPHEAEMPDYFVVGYLGTAVTSRLANKKQICIQVALLSFLSLFAFFFTQFFCSSHVGICEKTSESEIRTKTDIKWNNGEERSLDDTDSPSNLVGLFHKMWCMVPSLTWAMLVMKKGSQALKKSPRRTPSVRLAFRALRPCLWARRRSLFTEGCEHWQIKTNPD